ncbi:DUF6239 family natural product biosynthesis protein [Saccharothrix lopnurensis]|uniref:DUF6239 family natural product biosynthesis protein n=1 Tax=Saccharothrix lopnurensis TaxID=1670621 RepID=A0ABW1P3B8_9PSEU
MVVPASVVALGGVASAQHHDVEPVGASSLGGVWLRLLIVVALVVVAGASLLRPFTEGLGGRARAVVVGAAAVAVVGELALVPVRVERLDPNEVVVPVVLMTGALAVLPVLAWSGGRSRGWMPAVVGVGALVVGTDVAAVGELVAGEWSGGELRASALAWVAALAWLTLSTPVWRGVSRVVGVVAFAVAVAVVAAVPGFVAAGEHTTTSARGVGWSCVEGGGLDDGQLLVNGIGSESVNEYH